MLNKNLKLYLEAVIILNLLISCGNSNDDDSNNTSSTTNLITESLLNSDSLISFEIEEKELEDGTMADCYVIQFSSYTDGYGSLCPETIDDVGGIGFYYEETDGLELRVWSQSLLEDVEADGHDIMDDDGNVNIDYFDGNRSEDLSYCLESPTNEDITIIFSIPVTPVLAETDNTIEQGEYLGMSVDGIFIEGVPPSPNFEEEQIDMVALDPCGGHMHPLGFYHWHMIPEVVNTFLENIDITEIECTLFPQTTSGIALSGFAKDGFPIYAYAEEPDDLDNCGGRIAVTDEYPNGVYHYVSNTTSSLTNVPLCLKGLSVIEEDQYTTE